MLVYLQSPPAHPPLSLRDISPSRGERGGPLGYPATTENPVLDNGAVARFPSPPLRGRCREATEGGIFSWEAHQ
ncbi:MAG: hypothetical protein JWM58_1405 [Rhizobium sp.]|nr:hypothetical protein [Rhizobium sp.]